MKTVLIYCKKISKLIFVIFVFYSAIYLFKFKKMFFFWFPSKLNRQSIYTYLMKKLDFNYLFIDKKEKKIEWHTCQLLFYFLIEFNV